MTKESKKIDKKKENKKKESKKKDHKKKDRKKKDRIIKKKQLINNISILIKNIYTINKNLFSDTNIFQNLFSENKLDYSNLISLNMNLHILYKKIERDEINKITLDLSKIENKIVNNNTSKEVSKLYTSVVNNFEQLKESVSKKNKIETNNEHNVDKDKDKKIIKRVLLSSANTEHAKIFETDIKELQIYEPPNNEQFTQQSKNQFENTSLNYNKQNILNKNKTSYITQLQSPISINPQFVKLNEQYLNTYPNFNVLTNNTQDKSLIKQQDKLLSSNILNKNVPKKSDLLNFDDYLLKEQSKNNKSDFNISKLSKSNPDDIYNLSESHDEIVNKSFNNELVDNYKKKSELVVSTQAKQDQLKDIIQDQLQAKSQDQILDIQSQNQIGDNIFGNFFTKNKSLDNTQVNIQDELPGKEQYQLQGQNSLQLQVQQQPNQLQDQISEKQISKQNKKSFQSQNKQLEIKEVKQQTQLVSDNNIPSSKNVITQNQNDKNNISKISSSKSLLQITSQKQDNTQAKKSLEQDNNSLQQLAKIEEIKPQGQTLDNTQAQQAVISQYNTQKTIEYSNINELSKNLVDNYSKKQSIEIIKSSEINKQDQQQVKTLVLSQGQSQDQKSLQAKQDQNYLQSQSQQGKDNTQVQLGKSQGKTHAESQDQKLVLPQSIIQSNTQSIIQSNTQSNTQMVIKTENEIPEIKLKGLKLGENNSCYMNASIQLLYSMDLLREKVINYNRDKKTNYDEYKYIYDLGINSDDKTLLMLEGLQIIFKEYFTGNINNDKLNKSKIILTNGDQSSPGYNIHDLMYLNIFSDTNAKPNDYPNLKKTKHDSHTFIKEILTYNIDTNLVFFNMLQPRDFTHTNGNIFTSYSLNDISESNKELSDANYLILCSVPNKTDKNGNSVIDYENNNLTLYFLKYIETNNTILVDENVIFENIHVGNLLFLKDYYIRGIICQSEAHVTYYDIRSKILFDDDKMLEKDLVQFKSYLKSNIVGTVFLFEKRNVNKNVEYYVKNNQNGYNNLMTNMFLKNYMFDDYRLKKDNIYNIRNENQLKQYKKFVNDKNEEETKLTNINNERNTFFININSFFTKKYENNLINNYSEYELKAVTLFAILDQFLMNIIYLNTFNFHIHDYPIIYITNNLNKLVSNIFLKYINILIFKYNTKFFNPLPNGYKTAITIDKDCNIVLEEEFGKYVCSSKKENYKYILNEIKKTYSDGWFKIQYFYKNGDIQHYIKYYYLYNNIKMNEYPQFIQKTSTQYTTLMNIENLFNIKLNDLFNEITRNNYTNFSDIINNKNSDIKNNKIFDIEIFKNSEFINYFENINKLPSFNIFISFIKNIKNIFINDINEITLSIKKSENINIKIVYDEMKQLFYKAFIFHYIYKMSYKLDNIKYNDFIDNDKYNSFIEYCKKDKDTLTDKNGFGYVPKNKLLSIKQGGGNIDLYLKYKNMKEKYLKYKQQINK